MATTPTTYGGYNVDPTWKFFAHQDPSGEGRVTYFNPTDKSQNFTTSSKNTAVTEPLFNLLKANELPFAQSLSEGFMELNPGSDGTALNKYRPTSLLAGGGRTYEQLQEQARVDALAQQVGSGAMSVQQGTQAANDPNQDLSIPKPLDEPKPAPRMIQKKPSQQAGQGGQQQVQAGVQDVQMAQPGQPQAQGLQMPSAPQGLRMPTFYKPDPNSPQVFNERGEALSYEQYIAQGGTPTFNNVVSGPVPQQQQVQTAQQPTAGDPVEVAKQQSEFQKTLERYGVSSSEIEDPTKFVKDVYDKVYANLGVTAAKTQFDNVNKQLLDLRNKKTDEISKINNDPWKTEGMRVTEIRKLDEKYEQKEANLLSFLALADTMYQNGLSQAQFVTSSALSFVQSNQQFAQSLALNDLNFQQNLQLNAIQRQQQQADARFQLAQGMPFFKYENNPTVYSTDTGKPISSQEEYQKLGGNGSFTDVHEILTANTGLEKTQIIGLMQNYPDAGIRPTDPLDVAEGKVRDNSRIYQEQVRPPQRAGGGGGAVGPLGLTNTQIDNISPLVTQFQNSPIVQNYNTIGEGFKFASSLADNTTNPADDQALIYALAKALDPGSVVREGEYATVQKYAQSMAQSYGKSVTQAINGSGFLSQDARRNIKATIGSRFRAAESSYQNLFSETERRVNLIGGTDVGGQLLNNYGGAFAPAQSNFVGPVNTNPQPTQQSTPASNFLSKALNWIFQ